MRVRFIGSGDAFGSGGRLQTCILVETHGARLLIDCGASSLCGLKGAGVEPNSIDAVVVSHLHGDHFGGLPFLLLDAMLVSRRTQPLSLLGPPGFAERLAAAREVLFPRSTTMQPRFPLNIDEIEPGQSRTVAGAAVSAFEVAHFCGAPPLALRLEADGKSLCYTGDTEWTDSLIEAAHGVDLLIAEAYFYDKQVKFHLDYATLEAHLPQIGAREVILTHMSGDMLAHVDEVDVDCAEDGLVVEV